MCAQVYNVLTCVYNVRNQVRAYIHARVRKLSMPRSKRRDIFKEAAQQQASNKTITNDKHINQHIRSPLVVHCASMHGRETEEPFR